MTTNKGKKISGGRYIKQRKKKKYEIAGQRITTKLGENKRKTFGVRGMNKKTSLLRGNWVNVKSRDKKIKKIGIKNVLETPSNRFLARQNIITKGTIVETEIGKVRITNRPTQEGILNGVLIE